MSDTVAVVTAAGSGERLGAGFPKAFVELGGCTMLERAVDGVLASGVVDRVVVAELNLGQYRREIERLAGTREVLGVHRVDGELIRPEQILEAIR